MFLQEARTEKAKTKVCPAKQNFVNPRTRVLDVKFRSPRPILEQQIKSRIADASPLC